MPLLVPYRLFTICFSFQNRDLGPGRYDPEYGGFSAKATEERADGPGWARQYEVARMAALPHLLHKEQWQQKKMLVIFHVTGY